MSIRDSLVRVRANDTTYSVAGNRDLTDAKIIVRENWEGDIVDMGLETVATDHVLALPAHVKVGGTEKAFKAYVGESLGYGFWQGGNFGYIHQWDTVENKPLLYKYPFSGTGIDLDFPVVGGFCDSRVGGWWLGAGGWFEIVTPTWRDPSWDWVSSAYTYYTDKTKCNGRVYVYRIGATYYIRIWTLTNGIWGYVTHSGWGGITEGISLCGGGMWEWDGDVYYAVSQGAGPPLDRDNYYKNGVFIKDVVGDYSSGSGKIIVSDSFTYIMEWEGRLGYIYSKIDKVGTLFPGYSTRQYLYLIDTDKCIITNKRWDDAPYYSYINGNIRSAEFPFSSSNFIFNGGEDGKALRSIGGSYDYQLEGFDPVANTWTDYGRPWG